MKLTPQYFKTYLQAIYNCKEDYEVHITSKTPKTRLGYYKPDKKFIVIHYIGRRSLDSLQFTAIHELAHHVHYTEFDKIDVGDRTHGKEFYTILNVLLLFAAEKSMHRCVERQRIELSELLKRKI